MQMDTPPLALETKPEASKRFNPIALPPGREPASILIIRDRGYDASDNATIASWEASQKVSR